MRSAQAMASAFRTPEMYWDHEHLFAGLAISVRPSIAGFWRAFLRLLARPGN